MQIYNNIDDFLLEMFPDKFLEHIVGNKNDLEKSIEEINDEFEEKLEKILKSDSEAEENKQENQ